jgi:hypothetical protein
VALSAEVVTGGIVVVATDVVVGATVVVVVGTPVVVVGAAVLVAAIVVDEAGGPVVDWAVSVPPPHEATMATTGTTPRIERRFTSGAYESRFISPAC